MAKFLAEMKMFYVDGEESRKLAEKEAKVTETAPDFFAKMVGEKLMENRRAEDFSKLTPPNKIHLHLSISHATGGTMMTIKPEKMTREEVEEEVMDRIEMFIDLLSGRGTSDSNSF